jgi:hypothetical protein
LRLNAMHQNITFSFLWCSFVEGRIDIIAVNVVSTTFTVRF